MPTTPSDASSLVPPAAPSPSPRTPLVTPSELASSVSRRAPVQVPAKSTRAASSTAHLTPSPPADAAPSARLEVLVLASDGISPIPHACVEFRQADPRGEERSRILRTGESGRVTLDATDGPLALVAWDRAALGGPLALEVAAGWNGTVELILEPTREVTGRILDATNGAPIAGARVSFWCTSTLDLVRTAADGSFSHPRFPPSAMAQQVRVEAPGYGACVRYLQVDREGNWEFPAATALGNTRSGQSEPPWIEIELVPALQVRGRVVGDAGQPLPGALVAAEGYYHTLPGVASRDGAETRTNELGRFDLQGLRADIGHSLVVEYPGYAAECLELEVDGVNQRELGDVPLAPERLVAGVVIDQEGVPVDDIAIELVPLDTTFATATEDAPGMVEGAGNLDVAVRVLGQLTRQRTNSQGEFLFEGLEDVSYALHVLREETVLVEQVLDPHDAESSTALLIELPLHTLVLKGQVRDERGPVVGARVEVKREGTIGTVETDERGRFRVAGLDPRAAYRLHAVYTDAKGDVRHVHASVQAYDRPILRLGPTAQEGLALADQ